LSSRLTMLAATPLLLVGLSACGANVLPADSAAESAEDSLEEQFGVRPDISCPEDLEAEVGAEARCVLTGGDDPTEYGVTITVTSVADGNADFDVQVDEQPLD
jgi:hypothetical protein